MELNDFIEKFAEQFEETEKTVFNPHTRFKELDEWTSLTALSIIAMIDEEYNIS
ncbi:acyl carrier protein, partial [Bacteroides uniformis]